MNGQTVAAPGAVVYGRVKEAQAARRVCGQAKLVLELTDIKLGGQLIPIVSDVIALEGDRSGTVKSTGGAALLARSPVALAVRQLALQSGVDSRC